MLGTQAAGRGRAVPPAARSGGEKRHVHAYVERAGGSARGCDSGGEAEGVMRFPESAPTHSLRAAPQRPAMRRDRQGVRWHAWLILLLSCAWFAFAQDAPKPSQTE